ncbi:MAG: MFS transporter [Porphyromonadaceae bacterium]|nr:MAG: MFS transporter [Porphyromonadaceae bacterium]
MEEKKFYPVFGYRWVILAVYMFLSITIQIQWLAHAAVARPAQVFYHGQFNPDGLFNIDFLALLYMLVYIVVSIPASYVIDTYGIRIGLGIGAGITVAAGLLKGFLANSYMGVLIAQIGLSVAQPFILNAVTAITVRWFPLRERGMAAGLSALAQYLGIILAMLVTPLMIGIDPDKPEYGSGFGHMLMIYGVITAVAGILSLILIRETPPEPPGDELVVRMSFRSGLKHILGLRDMRIILIIFLIGLGIFNAVSSMTDAIAEHMGVKDSEGLIGGVMLIGGIIGAVIIPWLSDIYKKRKFFLVICVIGMVPGMICLSLADHLSSNPGVIYGITLAGSFIMGFFVMSAGPIGFQYAAEVSYPAPESTSQGLLLLIGQITGMIFVAGMSIHQNQYLGTFMTLFVALTFITMLLGMMLRESPHFR